MEAKTMSIPKQKHVIAFEPELVPKAMEWHICMCTKHTTSFMDQAKHVVSAVVDPKCDLMPQHIPPPGGRQRLFGQYLETKLCF